jgi:hypothetical protein
VVSPSYNASLIVYWLERGVWMTIVVPGLTTNPSYRKILQTKIPGGGARAGEDPWNAARREFREETGLKIKPKAKHTLVYLEQRGMHHKYAYLVHRSYCHGDLRNRFRKEKDSTLYLPVEIPLDDAIRIVHQPIHNQFHPTAHKILQPSRGLGIRSSTFRVIHELCQVPQYISAAGAFFLPF